MRDEYIKQLHGTFNASQEAQRLFERIAETPTARREGILRDVNRLKKSVGLSYALMALYRQQVNSGFVLGDPVEMERRNCKTILDPGTGITFRVQWNPHRELRKNHALLVERRVIAENVDGSKLINKREDGTACYLCKTNIDEQNPGEILVGTELAGEQFYAGANFSYITNNHFTVMNGRHRPQQYRKEIPQILNDFVEKTAGHFRAIFNGRAGASILWHEHIQAATESFPIEQIRIDDAHIIHEGGDTRVSRPDYYIPVWVIEGSDKERVGVITDRIIEFWHGLNQTDHTENIIAAKSAEQYRTFVILRDANKLSADKAGKKGALAAFETGGNIILSYQAEPGADDVNERHTFECATVETVRQLLSEIGPDRQSCSELHRWVSSHDLTLLSCHRTEE
ncbi:MAG: DUF4922 domain-containing protein [Planctomycetota bacterium]|jgi:hypothetical protein